MARTLPRRSGGRLARRAVPHLLVLALAVASLVSCASASFVDPVVATTSDELLSTQVTVHVNGEMQKRPRHKHYVSPSGNANGRGTITDPWDLQTALDHPAAVRR